MTHSFAAAPTPRSLLTRCVALAVGLALSSPADAGPWVRSLGEAYVKTGYSRFASRDFVQPDGERLDDARFLGQTANLYGEVGIGKNVQAVFDIPYVDSRNVVDGMPFRNRRLGDVQLGVEVGQLGSATPVSLQVLAKVPFYDNARFQGRTHEARYPAIGDGQVDLTAMLAVGSGVSVGPVRGWVSAEAGYRLRTELWLGDSSGPDRKHVDGLPFNVQVGWSPMFREKSAGWLFTSVSGIKNLATDESTREFVQLGVGGAFNLVGGLALEAGYNELVWARNSARGGGMSIGVSWSRWN